MFAANRRRSLSFLSVLVTEMATKYMDCSGFRITFPKQSARSPPNLVTKLKKENVIDNTIRCYGTAI